jgi:hypothetical protein
MGLTLDEAIEIARRRRQTTPPPPLTQEQSRLVRTLLTPIGKKHVRAT